jgi:hypothetical protein
VQLDPESPRVAPHEEGPPAAPDLLNGEHPDYFPINPPRLPTARLQAMLDLDSLCVLPSTQESVTASEAARRAASVERCLLTSSRRSGSAASVHLAPSDISF